MTSVKKIEANRRNALLSTGPGSKQGKEKSRANAVRIGQFARLFLLPGEDEEELERLAERVRARYEPQDDMQDMLVSDIIRGLLNLNRMGLGEAEHESQIRARLISRDNEIEALNAERQAMRKNWAERQAPAGLTASESPEEGRSEDAITLLIPEEESTDMREKEMIGKAFLESIAPLNFQSRRVDFDARRQAVWQNILLKDQAVKKLQEDNLFIERRQSVAPKPALPVDETPIIRNPKTEEKAAKIKAVKTVPTDDEWWKNSTGGSANTGFRERNGP